MDRLDDRAEQRTTSNAKRRAVTKETWENVSEAELRTVLKIAEDYPEESGGLSRRRIRGLFQRRREDCCVSKIKLRVVSKAEQRTLSKIEQMIVSKDKQRTRGLSSRRHKRLPRRAERSSVPTAK